MGGAYALVRGFTEGQAARRGLRHRAPAGSRLARPVPLPVPCAVFTAGWGVGSNEAELDGRTLLELPGETDKSRPRSLAQAKHGDHCIYPSAQRRRVANGQHRRRVDQDEVRPLTQRGQHVRQRLIGDEFSGIAHDLPHGEQLENTKGTGIPVPALGGALQERGGPVQFYCLPRRAVSCLTLGDKNRGERLVELGLPENDFDNPRGGRRLEESV